MTRLDNSRIIRAAHGPELSAKSWLTEAPLRMLMNNLDPDVAENPQELVVYGGIGRAARDWELGVVQPLQELVRALAGAGRAVGGSWSVLIRPIPNAGDKPQAAGEPHEHRQLPLEGVGQAIGRRHVGLDAEWRGRNPQPGSRQAACGHAYGQGGANGYGLFFGGPRHRTVGSIVGDDVPGAAPLREANRSKPMPQTIAASARLKVGQCASPQ